MWFFLMYPTECDKQHGQCTSYPRTQAQRPRRRCSGNMCRDSSRHNSSNSHNSVPIQHCFLFRQLEIPTSGKRCGNARVSQTLHKSWGPRRDSGPFLNLIGLIRRNFIWKYYMSQNIEMFHLIIQIRLWHEVLIVYEKVYV